jgi:hypothetical protein
MIDRVAWDREHNPHRPYAEERDQVKHSTLPPGRTNSGRHGSDKQVSGPIEGSIAPKAGR